MLECYKNHFYFNRLMLRGNRLETVWNRDRRELIMGEMVIVVVEIIIIIMRKVTLREWVWLILGIKDTVIEISWCIKGICFKKKIRNFIRFKVKIWIKVFENFKDEKRNSKWLFKSYFNYYTIVLNYDKVIK